MRNDKNRPCSEVAARSRVSEEAVNLIAEISMMIVR